MKTQKKPSVSAGQSMGVGHEAPRLCSYVCYCVCVCVRATLNITETMKIFTQVNVVNVMLISVSSIWVDEVKRRPWRGKRKISWEGFTVTREEMTMDEARASVINRMI